MRTPLAALLATAAATALVTGQGMFFKASESKGDGRGAPDEALGPYYIPDKQCSGVVHNLSSACERVTAVRVLAVDAHGYPEISIEGPLQRASVRRRRGPRGCRGVLPVHVAVGCARTHRSSRAAPPLLGAPPLFWSPLPPMSPSPPAASIQ